MKMLYLTTWDFIHENTDGVCRKIRSQVVSFRKQGYKVDFLYIRGNKILLEESGNISFVGKVGKIKKTVAYMKMYAVLKKKKYDCVYNRFGLLDFFYYRVLKQLHHNGAKILIEIPTYPYEGERQSGFLYWLMFQWDRVYQPKLKRVVNAIATYSRDEEIFGIPTIQIRNGIDFSSVCPVSGRPMDDTIDLLAVALMQPYHGYERLLLGLRKYYSLGGQRKILCHLVGDGPEKKVYEKIVLENNLQDHVIFYGAKGGSELDEIYDRADIGVCTLGGYKKGLFWSSELKSREYLAKGLPIIIAMDLDVTEVMGTTYMLQYPNDESILNMEEIVSFYDRIYQEERSGVVKKIREAAENCISMDAVMQPVCAYIEQ